MIHDVTKGMIEIYIPPESIHDQWDIEGLEKALRERYVDRICLFHSG